MHNRREAIERYGNKEPEQEEAELLKQPEQHCVAGRQHNQQEKHYGWEDNGVFIYMSAWAWLLNVMWVMIIKPLTVLATLLLFQHKHSAS